LNFNIHWTTEDINSEYSIFGADRICQAHNGIVYELKQKEETLIKELNKHQKRLQNVMVIMDSLERKFFVND
jgi:archaellum biogenesis ATPase FlaH